MYYKAQANIITEKLNIKKNQRISKELHEKLPDRLKVKFKAHNQPADKNAAGFNQIIGDTPEEKAHREKVEKEDAEANTSSQKAAENKSGEDKPSNEKPSSAGVKQPPERKK